MRTTAALACSLLISAIAFGQNPPAKDAPIATVEDLWAGFDPRAVPLEIEVVKSWDEGDFHLEMIYFTGEMFEGEKTRIFGYLGRPKSAVGKIPCVLHVHGGGQTANLDWPRFWAKRGYVCLSFDFCGNTNLPELGKGYKREHYTRWGKAPADMMRVSGGLKMTPTPRHNPWYHWTLAARRGLTLLEAQPDVDKDKLGVFGISVGGTLTWGIAAVDSRVKAAVPIYGCGWEFYQYPPDVKAPVEPDMKLWRTFIAPEALASRITCPILWLNATNDGHGRMDLGFRTLDRVPAAIKGQVFTPNFDHHIEPAEARSLPLFMDAILKGEGAPWPATPKLDFTVRDNVPHVRVAPAQPEQVERVDVLYCLNNDWPTTRFWRSVVATRSQSGEFVAAAPFMAADDILFAFANVSYRSGVRISSRLGSKPVAELAGAKATLARQTLIDAMDTAADWHWVPAYTDPCRDDRFFAAWTGPDGERGFTLDPKTFGHGGATSYYFGTRKIGDPQFRGIGRKGLLIDCPATHVPEKLTVRLTRRVPPLNQIEFTAVLPEPIGDGAWRTFRMEPSQFKDAAGNVLPNWDHVEFFVLNGVNPANRPPVFKRVRWEDATTP